MKKQRGEVMKWLFIGLGSALAAALIFGGIGAAYRKRSQSNTDDIDGGVIENYWADVPKVIKSTEIVKFHAEISLTSLCDADDGTRRAYKGVYKLDAVLEDGDVLVRYDWYDHQGRSGRAAYKADADFMVRLQEIAAAYNFAQYNGYHYKVSGLPDMYGEILDIEYAGGEQIYAYDNQSGFLGYEADEELLLLFGCGRETQNSITSAESMTLTLHGMRGSSVYQFEKQCELRRYRETYRDGEDVLVPEASVLCDEQTMIGLMNTCGVLGWNGFRGKHPKNVSDGIMFRFEASVNGGQTIHADGSANFPKGYYEFMRALDAMLAEQKNDGNEVK